MKRALFLVRHGATVWTERGLLCGQTDVPLSPRGRSDALRLQLRLGHRRFDGVWSSDLSRAFVTARTISTRAAAVPELRELDFGRLEGRRWSDLGDETQEALVAFERFTAPGGEGTEQLRTRVERFLAGLAPGRHLLVTHGGVIRVILRARGCDRRVEPGGLAFARW